MNPDSKEAAAIMVAERSAEKYSFPTLEDRGECIGEIAAVIVKAFDREKAAKGDA